MISSVREAQCRETRTEKGEGGQRDQRGHHRTIATLLTITQNIILQHSIFAVVYSLQERHSTMINNIDRKIVLLVQENARIANNEIARQIGMAPSATLERVRKLEAAGTIRSYKAQLNPSTFGLSLLAFIFIRANEGITSSCVGTTLSQIPEVQEVHHVAGEDCYLVKVRVANPEALSRLLRERIGVIESVISTRTTVVLETMKETTDLPITPDLEKHDEDDRIET